MLTFDGRPDSKWYKKYILADDIWKEPVEVPEEILKAWREALCMYKKLQQQPEYIGEI